MGFLRAEFATTADNKITASIVWSYYYFWETVITETFDSLEKAKDWVLDQRCYHQIDDHTSKPDPAKYTNVPPPIQTMPDAIPYSNQSTNPNHFKRHRKN